MELDKFILETLRVKPSKAPRKIFSVKNSQVVSALNPERYRGMQMERQLPFKLTVSAVCEVEKARVSLEKSNAEEEFDWIRIDDLPNNPWEIQALRTEKGATMQGSFYEVKEDDVLLAQAWTNDTEFKIRLVPQIKTENSRVAGISSITL